MTRIVNGIIVPDAPRRRSDNDLEGGVEREPLVGRMRRRLSATWAAAVGWQCCKQSISDFTFPILLTLEIVFGCLLWQYNSVFALVPFVVGAWVLSLCAHEFAHALTAFYGGDTTVKDKGYLTLNVFRYTNFISSLLIPVVFLFLGGIGLPGGAVFIETSRLRSKRWESAVSLAGPFASFMCGLLACSPFWVLQASFDGSEFDHSFARWIYTTYPDHHLFFQGLAFNAFVQFSAVLLNMMPIPPFDGFGAVYPWLPSAFKSWLHQGQNYNYISAGGMILLFMMFWRVSVLSQIILDLTGVFGVPKSLVVSGLHAFRFIN